MSSQISFAAHVAQCVAFAAIVAGPLPLAAATLRAVRRQRVALDLCGKALVIVVVWSALQVATALLLGSASILRLPFVLAAEAALGCIGLYAFRASAGTPENGEDGDSPPGSRASALEIAFVSLTGLVALGLLASSALSPVSDFDGMAYHGPAIMNWYQQASLGELPFPPPLTLQKSFSYGWEMVSLLAVMPFRSDLAIAFPSPLAWWALGIATCGCATAFGASRRLAVVAALLTIAAPHIWAHATTLYVDVAFAAFLVAAIAMARRTWDARALTGISLAAIGLAASLKAVAFAYVAIPLILLVAGLLRAARSRRAGLTRPFRGASLVLAVAGAAGGLFVGTFWSVRNWVLSGNPLGFVEIRLAGRLLFPGFVTIDGLRQTSILRIVDLRDTFHLGEIASGLEAQLGLLVYLLMAGVLVVPFSVVRDRERRWNLLALILVASVAAWLYIGTPWSAGAGSGFDPQVFRDSTRFGLSSFALLAVLASVALSTWLDRFGGAPETAIPAKRGSVSVRGGVVAIAATLLFVLIVTGLYKARGTRDARRDAASAGATAFIRDRIPPGDRIGYAGGVYGLLAWAGSAERNVVLISGRSMSDDIARALLESQARFVAMGPPLNPADAELQAAWIRGSDRRFKHVAGRADTLAVFRFEPRGAAAARDSGDVPR